MNKEKDLKIKKVYRIWMADMTCLKCTKGVYEGYQPLIDRRKRGFTTPCPECGDVQPASMTQKEFREIRKRDK